MREGEEMVLLDNSTQQSWQVSSQYSEIRQEQIKLVFYIFYLLENVLHA